MMTAETIARALGGRRVGKGWMARCVSHQDKSPSLSITERGGKVLFFCHAGCPQRDVLAGLRARGLWPLAKPLSASERRAWSKAAQRSEDLARDAFAWHHAILGELDDRKAGAIDFDAGTINEEALETAAREHWRLANLDARGIVHEFTLAKRERPSETMRLLRAGRAWLKSCEAFALRAIDEAVQRRAGAA